MKFLLHALKPLIILVSVIVAMMTLHPLAFAETRLFVPDYRFGGGFDTQLVITNSSDRDSNIDLWAFVKTGELLGQEQLHIRAHGTRSLTLSEAFGPQSNENTGWLAAVSSGDGIQVSYNLLGEHTESREAQAWPTRELTLDMPAEGKRVIRLSNMSSVA